MPIPTKQILEQLDSGYAMLFLGAGSTRNCTKPDGTRGVTGEELAQEILKNINGGQDPGLNNVGLMQASEFYTSVMPGARSGLDRFIQDRLADLKPTAGHYIAASFPWRAIVTTNYNRVIEDAWGEAHASGYAASEIIPIRTDADLIQHQGDTKRARLYKPHGCLTIPHQISNRMVLTSLDYFESERIRKQIYDAIRSLSRSCSTIFVGYSLADYTFKNIFYTLYEELGQWASKSYSIGPIANSDYEKWLSESMRDNYKTTVINESFDTFMLQLLLERGAIHEPLKKKLIDSWSVIESDNARILNGLSKESIEKLPLA